MSGWTLATPTSTTLWLTLLGIGLCYAARTIEATINPREGLFRERAADVCVVLGLLMFLLSVVAYFGGVA